MPPKKNKDKQVVDDACSKVSGKPIKTWADMVQDEEQATHYLDPIQQQIQTWLTKMEQSNPCLHDRPLPLPEHPQPTPQEEIQTQLLQALQNLSQQVTSTPQPITSSPPIQSSHNTLALPSINKKPKSQYFLKPAIQTVLTMEDSYQLLHENITNFFPKGWYYKPHDITKPAAYYQAILEHSKSATFKHFERNGEPAYSTCHILKVLTPSQWGMELHKTQQFEVSSIHKIPYCPCYSYWDYQQAWYNTFFIQNKQNSHTWLIYFDTKIQTFDFPIWFLHWWDLFGNEAEILQPSVKTAFDCFKSNYKYTQLEKRYPPLLVFCAKFYLPWIISWNFAIDFWHSVPVLIRRFSAKWWDSFKINPSLTLKGVQKWLSSTQTPASALPSTSKPETQFLAQKAHMQSLLAGATSENFFSLMQQFVQEHKASTNPTSSHSSSNNLVDGLDDLNEDDCFGILPPP